MCTTERDYVPYNGSTGQTEPVKDDIGMRHPHNEDLNVPFVGVKTESGFVRRLKGFCRPQNEVMFHWSAADRAYPFKVSPHSWPCPDVCWDTERWEHIFFLLLYCERT